MHIRLIGCFLKTSGLLLVAIQHTNSDNVHWYKQILNVIFSSILEPQFSWCALAYSKAFDFLGIVEILEKLWYFAIVYSVMYSFFFEVRRKEQGIADLGNLYCMTTLVGTVFLCSVEYLNTYCVQMSLSFKVPRSWRWLLIY